LALSRNKWLGGDPKFARRGLANGRDSFERQGERFREKVIRGVPRKRGPYVIFPGEEDPAPELGKKGECDEV
jgi:hypothetical protein